MTSFPQTSTRLPTLAIFLIALVLVGARGGTEPGRYLTGGGELPPELQAQLDRHADVIRLGLNADWLHEAGINQKYFVEAVCKTAEAVKAGRMAGGVLYVDRMDMTTMPVAVGFLITEPEKRLAQYDTIYHAGDMTGPLVTVPLVIQALQENKLALDDTIAQILPECACAEKASFTVEQLLRNQTGLPTDYELPAGIQTRKEVLDYLKTQPIIERTKIKVHASPLNYLLLGLMIEKVYDRPLAELASEKIFHKIGMTKSVMALPVTWRQTTAPGPYSEWLGRLAWGESPDPLGYLLAPNAGHSGFFTTADDLGNFSRVMLGYLTIEGRTNARSNQNLPIIQKMAMRAFKSYQQSAKNDHTTSITLVQAVTPNPEIPGGDRMGLGYCLGRFGPQSFGWDGSTGVSWWTLPDRNGFIVFLSNMDHPNGRSMNLPDPRDEILPLLARSLGWEPSTNVDTEGHAADDSSP